jgi:anti-sigma-K factor RskA
MGSHETIQELIPMYALGSLSAEERRVVRQHLAECAECRAMYRAEKAAVGMLPHSVEPVEPSREAKLKLFARVDADLAQVNPRPSVPPRAPVQARPRRRWFAQQVFAFAMIALVALIGIGGWILLNNLASPEQRAIASILNDPNVQKVALSGTQDAPGAFGELYLVPGHSQAVLKVGGLAQLPQDKGYEFWFFRGGDPQASNVFTVNPDGASTVLVQANDKVENFKGWGVTIEPRAGVPKPTGTIVILGGL